MANNITNVWKLMGIDPTTGKGTYKNRMGLGNAITRDNGIPLDLSGLHATYNDAVVYAATSSIAYVDQPIAAEGVLYLITEASQGKVKIGNYRDSITGKLVESEEKEYDVYLKRVGIVPTGDDASIVVNGEGLVKIFAFDGAQTGTVPVKDENGKLVWKTLEEIGAGDGNDNTTYEFAVCDDKVGIVITPLFNGQPIMEGEGEEAKQVKYHLDLDVYTKAQTDSKIAEAIGNITFPEPPDLTPYATVEYVDGEVDKLEEAIAAIDFVDGDELTEALEPYATITYVDGEIDKLEQAIDDIGDRIPDLSPYATIEYVDGEVDKLEEAINNVDAKIPDVTPYATIEYVDGEVDRLEGAIAEKADADDLTALTNKVNAFLEGTGADDALDSLQELIEYINTHDDADIAGILEDIQALENKLAGIDTTVVAYVTAAIDALKIGDYAKASDLTALAARVKTLEDVDNATQAELNAYKEEVTEAIAKAKEEAIAAIPATPDLSPYATKEELTAHVNTAAETYETIAHVEETYAAKTALAEHIEEAEGKYATKTEVEAHIEEAEGKYATKTELEEHITAAGNTYATKTDVEAHIEEAESKYATKAELEAHGEAADGKYATKEELAPVTQTANNASTAVTNLEARFDEIVAVGGEPNAINKIKVNGTELGITDKTVEILNTQFDITTMGGYSALAGRVTKNENDIAALTGNLADTNVNVTANQAAIADINTNITTNITPSITALLAADATIEANVGANTEAIATLNATTIPALQQAIANEATTRGNAIDAINNKIGTVAADKTIVDMIADAQAAATYDDAAINALIAANTAAIGNETTRATGAEEALAARIKAYEDVKDTYATKTALEAEVARATAAEEANATAIEGINALLNTISDTDDITSLKELAIWVEEHGAEAAEMTEAITKNATDITALTARVGANETAIATHTTDIAAVLAKATANETTITAINNAETGILALAKAYADTKASEVALEAGTGISIVDKKINVTTVTTDQLVQGTETLILNGGSAEVKTANA